MIIVELNERWISDSICRDMVSVRYRTIVAVVLVWTLFSFQHRAVRGDYGIVPSGGPFGGNVQCMATDPSRSGVFYAGTEGGGVFKTTDGGNSWHITSQRNSNVLGLSIVRSAPDTIYAATVWSAVKSTNGGGTWMEVREGIPAGVTILSIAADPSSADIVYVGTFNGVFKSTNGGASWMPSSNALGSLIAVCLAVDPSRPNTIYAGAQNGGVFKSTDGGGNWTDSNAGISATDVRKIAIDPSDPETLYAIGGSRLFKSTDGAANWNLSLADANSVAVDPKDRSTIYAGSRLTPTGVRKSTDGGATWSQINNGLQFQNVVDLTVDNSSIVLAGMTDGGGVFRSADKGNNWNEANMGITATDAVAILVDPSIPNIVYAGVKGRGLYKSTDGGTTWSITGLTTPYLNALMIHPSNAQTIYAALAFGAFKSTDGGNSWVAIVSGLIDPSLPNTSMVYSLAVDPSSTRTLYAGSFRGLFRSDNDGKQWRQTSTPPGRDVYAIALHPFDSNTVYVATIFGVQKTTDAGASWTRGGNVPRVGFLAIDPSNPLVLYTAGPSAFPFKSADGGDHWTPLPIKTAEGSSILTSVVSIAPSSPNIIYAGTSGYGVFRSNNRGERFVQLSDGLNGLEVRSIAVDPSNPNHIFVGTQAGGVFSIRLQLVPRIDSASVSGKKLVVSGDNFGQGSVILIDGIDQKTLFDDLTPDSLVAKKGGKKINPGRSVTLLVRNADGLTSEPFMFTRQ